MTFRSVVLALVVEVVVFCTDFSLRHLFIFNFQINVCFDGFAFQHNCCELFFIILLQLPVLSHNTLFCPHISLTHWYSVKTSRRSAQLAWTQDSAQALRNGCANSLCLCVCIARNWFKWHSIWGNAFFQQRIAQWRSPRSSARLSLN